jgi:hypothetical protein
MAAVSVAAVLDRVERAVARYHVRAAHPAG